MHQLRIKSLLALSIITLALGMSVAKAQQPNKDDGLPSLDMIPDKYTLLPGEPLNLTFTVFNQTKKPVKTHKLIVGRGDIELLVAYEGEPYEKYRGEWITDYVGVIPDELMLAAGSQLRDEAVILYNFAKGPRDNKEMHYVFPKAGTYTLKARFDPAFDLKNVIESSPVRIVVEKPRGADAAVWERIKTDNDVAYFIYVNGNAFIDSEGGPDRVTGEKVVKTLQEVLSQHPTSTYARYLESALNNYAGYIEEWRVRRIEKVERTLFQAGYWIEKGDQDYGAKMIQGANNLFQEVKLFPKHLPFEAYLGLAYLLNKNYSKALQYLEPLAERFPASENRVVIEAMVFAHQALGHEEQALQTIQSVRPEQERKTVLTAFRERIKKGQTFTFTPYHSAPSVGKN